MDTIVCSGIEREITKALADFVYTLGPADLNDKVIDSAKMLTLDGFGNEIGAFGQTAPGLLYQTLEVKRLSGPSTVVGYGTKTSAIFAACMNAMLAHTRDVDAAHRDALTKTGAAVTPAVFAVGEACGATGEELLLATVVGYELMIRMGLAFNPSHRKRGFHSTSTLGAFGTAAAAGRLLGLTPGQMANAFGIAGTQAAGLTAFIDTPSMIKPFNVAKGVLNGVLAASLAKNGFTGPDDILESEEGFIHAYTDHVDTKRLFDRLGRHFHMTETGFKPHAACRYVHTLIDGALQLKKQHRIDPEQIERVDAGLSGLAYRQCNIETPQTVASAQGSAQFSIAASLTAGGETLSVEDFTTAFADPVAWAVNKKVTLRVLDDVDYMSRFSALRIRLKEGRSCEVKVELPKGEPENPMTKDEIREKYRKQAEPVVGKRNADSIYENLMNLEQLKDPAAVMKMTVAEER